MSSLFSVFFIPGNSPLILQVISRTPQSTPHNHHTAPRNQRPTLRKCMTKIFRGEGVVDGEGVVVKDASGCSLRDLSKNVLKQGVGKGKSCS